MIKSVFRKLYAWVESFMSMLPNIIVAGIVVLLFLGLSKLAAHLVSRAMAKFDVHDSARGLVLAFVRFTVVMAGVVVALGVMHLDRALASILAGAGIVGLALGFAFQDLAANLISGVGLAVHKRLPFQINDIIDTNDVLGIVTAINLRTTMIQTFDGKTVILPNKAIFQNQLTNYSYTGRLRVEIECGVSYGEDLSRVTQVATKALEDLGLRDKSLQVFVYFEGYGDSAIKFRAMFWIRYQKHADFLRARHEAVLAIKSAFNDAGITIPFPIRTLDFGIKGGERLASVLDETRSRPRRANRPSHQL